MPTTASPRLGLQAIDGADAANTIDTTDQAQVAKLDAQVAIYSQGSLGARPVSSPSSPGVSGRVYFALDEGVLYYDSGTGWVGVSRFIGDMKVSCRTVEAGGWIRADGRLLTAGMFPQLRAALIADGSPYNSSGGSPYIPDLQGRAPIGAGQGLGLANRAVGAMGGEESHVLSAAEMPVHAHAIGGGATTTAAGGTHAHTYGDNTPQYANWSASGTGYNQGNWTLDTQRTTAAGGSHAHSVPAHAHSCSNAGSGGGHNNMQPFTAVQWFIYAGPAE